MKSGFVHNNPQAIIDTDAGQLEALALAGKFVGTLSDLLTNKDGIVNVNKALADFDKKHTAHKAILSENKIIVSQIEEANKQIDIRIADVAAAEEASKASIKNEHQAMLARVDEGLEKATARANQIMQARIDKLDAREAELADREQGVSRAQTILDQREALLHEMDDKLKAKEKGLDGRATLLDAHAKKLAARHDEVTALEKSALKG